MEVESKDQNPSCKANEMLKEVNKKLDDLNEDLHKARLLIEDKFREIKVDLADLKASNIEVALNEELSDIDAVYNEILWLVHNGDTASRGRINLHVSRILHSKLADYSDTTWSRMNNLILGRGPIPSVYKSYWDYLRTKNQYIGPADIALFNAYIDVYSLYIAKYAFIKTEIWHASDTGLTAEDIQSELQDVYLEKLNVHNSLKLDDLEIPESIASYTDPDLQDALKAAQESGDKVKIDQAVIDLLGLELRKRQRVYFDPGNSRLWSRYSFDLSPGGISHSKLLLAAKGKINVDDTTQWVVPTEWDVVDLMRTFKENSQVLNTVHTERVIFGLVEWCMLRVVKAL